MSAHRTVIEAGPGTIRRICCGPGEAKDTEMVSTALDGIDDPVVLVDEQPVAVAALWEAVLRSLACPDQPSAPESVLVIHPSWWSAPRVGLVTAAAHTLADEVVARPRSQLLAAAAPDPGTRVVVEVAARLVAITAAGTVAEPRSDTPDRVADEVVRRVVALTRGVGAAVLIDGPDSVGGAAVLAAMIAERLRAALTDTSVQLIDDARLARLAAPVPPAGAEPRHLEPASRRSHRIPGLLTGMGVVAVLGVVALGAGSRSRQDGPAAEAMPTTFLVEGRVALEVPAQWPVQRVTSGPGSPRVQVISPSDPQVMLHVTQSLVPGGTLSAAAESLEHGIERANTAESAGVFVDFNPSGQSAGRPAVTYREVREGHHIDWTVLVDGAARISIGCQSRPDDADAVREACEQAVRSARALS